ncbi:MAG: AI-2E family transporter [Candidatus Pacearchaeota archaeon]|nr:AI-2E family transporter [Candidatus Pacearchaeota archaeon]
MELNEKTIRELSAIALILIFAIIVFFIIKPIIFAILWGLILAYIFMPIFNFINKYTNNRALSATLVLILSILLIVLPLWLIIPLIVQQIFEIFRASQSLDIYSIINNLFPNASQQFLTQLSTSLNSMISKLTSSIMNSLVNVFLNVSLVIINLLITGMVFFFSLKDADKLKDFVKGISPISKSKEKILVQNFKDITYSILFGNLVVGVIQGIICGIGFWIFGIKNALSLSLLAVFLAVLPIAGVYLLWVPLAIYMFIMGNFYSAIAFSLFNIFIVSNIDNILRAYILSRKTNLSTLFAFISSIGGLFVFGIIGLILGPLIFAYFIILIDLYREKSLLSLFYEEDQKQSFKIPFST